MRRRQTTRKPSKVLKRSGE